MPFRRPLMSQLLLQNREVDARVREALQEAKAKRDLGLERRGEKLRTLGWRGRTPNPLPRLDESA